MTEMLRRIMTDPASHAVAWAVALVYVLLFQVAVADLTIDGAWRPASLFVVGSWQDLVLRTRAPFQFEAVAVVEAPFLIWLLSPMNIAVGLALGLLTGIQVALVRIAPTVRYRAASSRQRARLPRCPGFWPVAPAAPRSCSSCWAFR